MVAFGVLFVLVASVAAALICFVGGFFGLVVGVLLGVVGAAFCAAVWVSGLVVGVFGFDVVFDGGVVGSDIGVDCVLLWFECLLIVGFGVIVGLFGFYGGPDVRLFRLFSWLLWRDFGFDADGVCEWVGARACPFFAVPGPVGVVDVDSAPAGGFGLFVVFAWVGEVVGCLAGDPVSVGECEFFVGRVFLAVVAGGSALVWFGYAVVRSAASPGGGAVV